ncbi:hypothetical protein [Actinomadura madurae]|uniref:hypothetical protein n=1 Tax=Actinomadura madurae TaxID=1993 RepID=UPI000D9E7091|nr:hypothetical protein [Actinomadura madurae]SPT60946.1 Uncharacterised protein [Actinomadura madurae]
MPERGRESREPEEVTGADALDEADATRDLLASAVLRRRHRDELERLMGTPEFRTRFASSRTLTQAAAGPAGTVTFFRETGELVEFLDWSVRPRLEEFACAQGVADVRAAEIAQAALAWIVREHPDPADPAVIEGDLDLAHDLIGALAGQGAKSRSAPGGQPPGRFRRREESAPGFVSGASHLPSGWAVHGSRPENPRGDIQDGRRAGGLP